MNTTLIRMLVTQGRQEVRVVVVGAVDVAVEAAVMEEVVGVVDAVTTRL
ncbi:hypothetical protein JBE38_03295 [Pseudomonas sp. ICBG1301]|nr:hypothetical protein [Pseudomonas sp. ICBG1301]MBM9484926.1 hypothetical protein [Pseudomonas sp. ICBG1301]